MSQIVINLELYEGKDIISGKDHVREYDATAATTLRLTQPYHGSDRCIVLCHNKTILSIYIYIYIYI